MTGALQQTPYSLMQLVNVNGALTMPVKPAHYIYSQFDYIRGIPATSSQPTIPISKLKILDTLVSHMVKTKQKVATEAQNPQNKSDAHIEAMIKQLQQQIKTTESLAKEIPMASPTSASPTPGLLFSIDA